MTQEQAYEFSRHYQQSLAASPLELDEGQALSLEAALMRAYRENLAFRVKALEAALATGNRQLANMSLLPSLTAEAGYRWRDSQYASVSESVITGRVSLEPSTSSDRKSNTRGLELSWDMLDFALAWSRARSASDEVLLAEEERRRVLHQVGVDLIYAWDQAVAFQSVQAELEMLRESVDEALLKSDSIARQRLQDPVTLLDYRKSLLLLLKRINRLSSDMNQAQDQLAEILRVPVGRLLVLKPDSGELPDFSRIGLSEEKLRLMALQNRPEIRQAMYRERMTDREAFRDLAELFPSLMLRYGTNHDSNSFLVESRWQDASASLSWNLMNILAIPARRKQAEMKKALARTQLEMEAAAVMSQVAISVKAMSQSRRSHCLSQRLAEIDSRKLSIQEVQSRQASFDRLSLLRSRLDNLLIRLEASLDNADMRRDALNLLAAAGVGIFPDNVTTEQLADAEAIQIHWLSRGMMERLDELSRLIDQQFEHLPDADENVFQHGAGMRCG